MKKEFPMVKLYKFDTKKGDWVFVDYGVESKTEQYLAQGYVVRYR